MLNGIQTSRILERNIDFNVLKSKFYTNTKLV